MSYPTYLPNIGNEVADLIDDEIGKAKKKHGPKPFNSPHEGISVIREEFEELWDEVKKDGSKEDMKKEAIQLAAMAIRFIKELTVDQKAKEHIGPPKCMGECGICDNSCDE